MPSWQSEEGFERIKEIFGSQDKLRQREIAGVDADKPIEREKPPSPQPLEHGDQLDLLYVKWTLCVMCFLLAIFFQYIQPLQPIAWMAPANANSILAAAFAGAGGGLLLAVVQHYAEVAEIIKKNK